MWWQVPTKDMVHGVETSHLWWPALFSVHKAVVHDLLDFLSDVIRGREPYVLGVDGRQMRWEQVDNTCPFR